MTESQPGASFRVIDLDALVRMKLTSFRIKDQVHLLDLIGIGIIDSSWVSRVPPEFAPRLRQLIDNPQM